jgi:hypothetical protein
MTTTYSWKTYRDFIANVPPAPQDVDYFSQVDWLQPYLGKTGPYRAAPFFSRLDKGTTLDRFYNKVINTPDTIPHALALVRKDDHYYSKKLSNLPTNHDSNVTGSQKQAPIAPTEWDFILLVHLRPDLSGFKDTAHGGLLGALFDEAMGCCTSQFRADPPEELADTFTANLNVSFRATVELPGVYAIRIRLEGRQGRKWFNRGDLVGSDGRVRTEAESLWITTKPEGKL